MPGIFPEYVGTAEANRLQMQIEHIAEKLLNKEVQFLFGAGMSRASLIPTGREMATELLSAVYPEKTFPSKEKIGELLCSFPFECIAEAAQSALPAEREDLKSRIEIMFKKSKGPHEGHKMIAKLCGGDYIDRIYTTNFDLLFEEQFKEPRCVTVTKENIREVLKNDGKKNPVLPIFHLHGILSRKFLITESDVYDTTDQEVKLLRGEFIKRLDADVFVFVGYSMADPDFRQIYMEYYQQMKEREDFQKNTYIVNLPKDYYEYELANYIWKSRKATLMPCDINDFLKELWDCLNNKAIKDLKKRTAEKLGYGSNPASFQELLDNLKKDFKFNDADAIYYLDLMTRGRGRS